METLTNNEFNPPNCGNITISNQLSTSEQVGLTSFSRSARSVFNRLKVSRFTFRHIPKEMMRKKNVEQLALPMRTKFVYALDTCLRRLANLLFPQDGEGLYKMYIESRMEDTKIVEGIIRAIGKTKKGSTEKRVLRAVLYTHMPAHRVKSLESKYALTEEVRSNRESEEVVGVSEDKSSENFEEESCKLNTNKGVYVHSSDEHEQCDIEIDVRNCNHVVGH